MISMNKQLLWSCALALSFICTPSFAYISVNVQNATHPTPVAAQPMQSTTTTAPTTTKYKHTYKHHYKAPVPAFAKKIEGTGRTVFIFDPRVTAWAVYDADGNLLKTGRGSGGRNYCPDIHRACHTPVGVFQVYAHGGAGCKSKKFPVGRGGAPMPYCSYFHGGYAVHGSYEVRSYNASHGCIRIYPADAKWLQTVLPVGSTVIVKPY
jgi:hypothetical protein